MTTMWLLCLLKILSFLGRAVDLFDLTCGCVGMSDGKQSGLIPTSLPPVSSPLSTSHCHQVVCDNADSAGNTFMCVLSSEFYNTVSLAQGGLQWWAATSLAPCHAHFASRSRTSCLTASHPTLHQPGLCHLISAQLPPTGAC